MEKVNIRLSSKAGGDLQPRARREGGGGGRRDDFQIYCGKLKECRRPRARVPARLCVCVCACALRFNPLSFRAFSARALLCV